MCLIVLIDKCGSRKYLNKEERERFISAITKRDIRDKLFYYMLLLSGVRISEALQIKVMNIDFSNLAVNIESLKKRSKGKWRQIPLPEWYVKELKHLIVVNSLQEDSRIWIQSRRTATRHIQNLMDYANIKGKQACSRGLRHGFGVHCILSDVPLNVIKKWMGHESIQTTIIYLNVTGKEERGFAEKMWM